VRRDEGQQFIKHAQLTLKIRKKAQEWDRVQDTVISQICWLLWLLGHYFYRLFLDAFGKSPHYSNFIATIGSPWLTFMLLSFSELQNNKGYVSSYDS